MKKQVKRLLSVGLCLALGLSVGGGIVACNGEEQETPPAIDWSAGTWSTPAESHWIAGTLAGYDNTTLDNDGWGGSKIEEIPAERMFEQNSFNDKLYRLVINLYEGDSFKIRYGTGDWGTGGQRGNIGASGNLDTTVADKEKGIYDQGGGMGGSEFAVAADGQYELRINETGSTPIVTYVRKGDAPKLAVAVSSVKLDQTSLTLKVNDEVTLVATVKPDDADDKTVKWTSDKESVATVDKDGKVKAVAEGEAKITATAGEKSATCTVVVTEGEVVEVTGVTLNKTETTLHIGAEETLTATVAPDNATNKAVTYESSEPTVVSVDTDGKIKALKTGTATITAKAGADKAATCEVTVPADYYLAGASKSPAFDGESWNAGFTAISDVPTGILFTADTDDANKYTLEVALYAGDSFAIIPAGVGWDGQIRAKDEGVSLAKNDNAETRITVGGNSDGKNIGVSENGKYLITLTITDGEPTLSYKYLDEAPAVDVAYDIIAKGNWKTNWGDFKVCATGLDADGSWTGEFTIKLAANAEFGFFTALTGTTAQKSWMGEDNPTFTATGTDVTMPSNISTTAGGVFKFTVVVDDTGKFKSITVETATADDNTVDATVVTPAEGGDASDADAE